MTTTEYHAKLETVVSDLSERSIEAECRGEGWARFVYARIGDRAIEISRDGVGVFIEMFEEPSEASIRQDHQKTFESGTEEAVWWLTRRR